MLLGIDHLVVAVRDPDAAAKRLERTIGLAFSGGGRHEHAGTFNRLAFLGDTYLELIGVFDRGLVLAAGTFAVGRAALALLDAGREGLATYALASDDIERDVRALWAEGSPIGEPVAGSRVRPDGGVVRWITAFPDLRPDRPPFLIEHERAGAEWGPEDRAAWAAFRHPVGGRVRLTAIEIPVAHPRATAVAYAATIGVVFDEGAQSVVGGQAIRLRPADGAPPVVRLAAEPGTRALDVVRFGLRWIRT